jgi:hypothetical protein
VFWANQSPPSTHQHPRPPSPPPFPSPPSPLYTPPGVLYVFWANHSSPVWRYFSDSAQFGRLAIGGGFFALFGLGSTEIYGFDSGGRRHPALAAKCRGLGFWGCRVLGFEKTRKPLKPEPLNPENPPTPPSSAAWPSAGGSLRCSGSGARRSTASTRVGGGTLPWRRIVGVLKV